jgi:(p)ppGpp synthase/HD superfamily hydrolase
MIYTNKIQKAINLAIETHELNQKQKRKGKDIPYITHPQTVGLILSLAGAKEEIIIAGILHDTIEDSVDDNKITKEMVESNFGKEVADLVVSVTETDKSLSWEDRKKEALEHIKHFSKDSLLLKSADVISNLTELIEDYKKDGDEIFKRFNAPKDKLLNSSISVIETILVSWKENPLARDLENSLAEIRLMVK